MKGAVEAERAGCHAWLFATKGIQGYIFSPGRLRDLIGASDLVSSLASSDGDDLIGATLKALDDPLGPDPTFSRRAGGAFCLHGRSDILGRVRAQFTLAVSTALPGLEYSDAIGSGDTELAAMRAAFANVGGIRNNGAASVLPLGRPAMRPAPLTGRPATAKFAYRGKDEVKTVLADAVMAPQRQRADAFHGTRDGVSRRFLPDAEAPDGSIYEFPRTFREDFEDTFLNPWFPWRKDTEGVRLDERRIAIVHADISGLGETFLRRGRAYSRASDNLALAAAIERAILLAAQTACREVLLPVGALNRRTWPDTESAKAVVPARPIVLGGDDVTVLVRADLALDFAARLLELIEETTADEAIGGLSACAGIAVVGRGTPFLAANMLAESLCTYAKRKAKQVPREKGAAWPSALAFHSQTHDKQEDYERDVLPTLVVQNLTMTANPFAVGERSASLMDVPSFAQLKAIAVAIAAIPGAAAVLRTIEVTLARGTLSAAISHWREWRRSAARNRPQGLLELDAAIAATTGCDSIEEYRLPEISGATPLFDALRMLRLGAVAAEPESA